MTDPRKKSLHLPPEVMAQIRAEAHRLDRPISWLVQHAWTLAKDRMRGGPTLAPQGDLAQTRLAPVERPARVLEPLDALGRARSPDHPREPDESPDLWPFGEPTF